MNNGQYNGQNSYGYTPPQQGGQPVDYYAGRQPEMPRQGVQTVQPVVLPQAASYQKPGEKKKSGSGKFVSGLIIGLICSAVMGASAMGVYLSSQNDNNGNNAILPPQQTVSSQGGTDDTATDIIDNEYASPQTNTELPDGDYTLLNYAQVAKKVRPSVCTVIAHYLGTEYGGGSGIILSEDGYIVTNAHVVHDDNYPDLAITCKIMDDSGAQTIGSTNYTEYEAKIVGYDTKSDVALLKVNASGLTAAAIGDSTVLVEGDEVVAIGTPLDEAYTGTVTNGIISGIDRVIDNADTAIKYLQTNAAINPGNSGGALVNMYGQVIGINTAKIVAEGYEGIGFAIPMDSIKDIISELQEHGIVIRPALGITCGNVSKSTAELYDIPMGVQIITIMGGSDLLGKAEVYDIITAIDGRKTEDMLALQTILSEKQVGDQLTLTLYRARSSSSASKTYDITITLVADNTLTEAKPKETGSRHGDSSFDDYGGFDFGFGFDDFWP